MKANPLKPRYKMKKKYNQVTVRTETHADFFISPALEFFIKIYEKFLKYDFGYKDLEFCTLADGMHTG
jgi:hypothetical protein